MRAFVHFRAHSPLQTVAFGVLEYQKLSDGWISPEAVKKELSKAVLAKHVSGPLLLSAKVFLQPVILLLPYL
ncbi:hypothetical protein SN13_14775 [Vibrio alginolyticus]|nr:hypothetical protein SN12_20865 [Vibrio alginolyticus]KIP82431.1 hypothetical protein SN13_14775 [Vibrio alginolyticus]